MSENLSCQSEATAMPPSVGTVVHACRPVICIISLWQRQYLPKTLAAVTRKLNGKVMREHHARGAVLDHNGLLEQATSFLLVRTP